MMDSNRTRQYVEPIRTKWIYHFVISPKTNVIEKPEWYFNQTLKWINQNIDTAPNKSDFITCMLELPLIRLSKDMKWIKDKLEDDGQAPDQTEILLIHTYNEVVQFTKVIRQLLGDRFTKLDDKHDLMSVFSDQLLFERIIDVEEDNVNKNFKDITNLDTRWEPVLGGEFVDSYKIPRCVDRLLLLVKALTERVQCFQQLDCQFQLIELQCCLFEKFLLFLKKSTDSSSSKTNILSDILFFSDDSTIDLSRILAVLNGVNFLRLILKDQYFIPRNIVEGLNEGLAEKSKKLASDYRRVFEKLVERVVAIYRDIDCDHDKFLQFIQPKLAQNAYETIHDKISSIHQRLQTDRLLKSL